MAAQPERLGRYRLLERLGQGGMATVYRAEDDELHRAVAVKLMHPFLSSSAEAAGRFQREARAVAALRHPNVLQVHDYAPEEGERPAYLVTELIQGPTLKQFLDEHGAPLAEVAAMIGVKLARALSAAHAQGIVHRDVKPENVMVDQGGRIVLCDFGIARLADGSGTMTATGALIGSPAYMSPEQAAGDELDHRSDLFSLGTVLYLASTGGLPFVAKEPLVLLSKIHRGEHLPPSAKNPRVPPYLERAIERCLRVSREARFSSAEEVAAALEAGLRADGLGEVDREIAAYFADPPGYNAAAEPRIVATSLEQAKRAAASGEVSRALGLCNRVLAWRPDDEAARTLIVRIGRSGRLRRVLAVAGGLALLALAGIAGGRALWHPSPPAGAVAAPKIEGAPAKPGPLPTVAAPPTANAALQQQNTALQQPLPATVEPTHPARATHDPPRKNPPPRDPVSAPVPVPVAAADPAPVAAPAPGSLKLLVKPYCEHPTVDGAPVDAARVIALPPGAHQVRCDYQGRTLEREVQIVAGERFELAHNFVAADATVAVKLTRGDAISVEDGPRTPSGATIKIAPGEHKNVVLWKGGQAIDRNRLDIPPGGCRLRDEPLECVKP